MRKIQFESGFTIIELLIVIIIIAILANLVLTTFTGISDSALLARAHNDTSTLHKAIELQRLRDGVYPADLNRSLPPGIESFVDEGVFDSAPWPGSVYDWDNWTDPSTGESIYQISIRFCEIGQPQTCNFPNTEWAADFDINSSVYRCISGPCRSHISEPIDHPGYCLNCSSSILPNRSNLADAIAF